MKKIAILQSNYIPWKGFFDSLNSVDTFVIYDDMQYTKRDWRNRNIIKTPEGLKWLTIPVEVSGKFYQKIKDTKVAHNNWNKSHLESIKQSYKGASFFKEHWEWVENMYFTCNFNYLSEINMHFIKEINEFLNINTEIRFSSEFFLSDERTMRLVDICKVLNVTDYYSGPSAKSYINSVLFHKNNVNLHFFDYGSYRVHSQIHGAFTHGVSILDTILNIGKEETKNQFIF
jgi:hypothetical protein